MPEPDTTEDAVRLDLHDIVAGPRVNGHLPECPHRLEPLQGCDWCLWALDHSGVRGAVDRVGDARALIDDHDRRSGDVSVAWVVAADDLLAPVDRSGDDAGVPDEVVVPSVREILHRLHLVTLDELRPLRRRLDLAVGSDGSVERRCLAGSAALASAALQRPSEHQRWEALPDRARVTLQRASELVSVDTQVDHLSVGVERLHWDGVPDLRTQPEWRRRPDPHPPASLPERKGRPGRTELLPAMSTGSLESFVVEAVMDDLADDLGAVVDDLLDVVPAVPWIRDPSRRRLSAATRRITWRRARIDWHLTFLDTGRSTCWRHDDGTTRVPWTVALAIEEAARLGQMSATHSTV